MNRKKRISFCYRLGQFFIAISLCSCMMPDNTMIEVVMPRTPPGLEDYLAALTFTLVFPGSSNKTEYTMLFPGSSAVISFSHPVLPVMAVPSAGLEAEPYAAGGIYPADFNGKVMQLSWENGFAASAVYQAVCAGIGDFSNFNIARFEKTLFEKSGGNPWVYSEDLLLYALSKRIFNSNYLRKKAPRDIYVNLPFPGDAQTSWVLSNMLDRRVFETVDSYLEITDIPERSFRLFSLSGKADIDYIDFILNSGGWFLYCRRSQTGKSGNW